MTLRKNFISKTAFFFVLFLMIFGAGFFSSCKNIFGNSNTSIEEEQIQNDESKSQAPEELLPATDNSEPKPIIVSGRMTITGAVPQEALPQDHASRSAVPVYLASEVEYFVTAVSGSRTVDGTFGSGADAANFTIALLPGLEWDITCGLRKRSSGGVAGAVLFSAVKTGLNPANLANNTILQFFPTPDISGGSGSTGEIELSMTVDSTITSVEITCFSSNKSNWNISSASISGTTATIKSNILYPVRSGVYEVVIDFYKSGHALAYSTVQTINVCKGLKTQKWISSGGISPIESNGTFNVSSAKIASFTNTNYYVGTISGAASPSDSNNGNHKAPFATLSKAISQIESQATASGSATNLEYKIFISGTVSNTSSVLASVPELGSSLNGKASKISIRGIANATNPPVIQTASSLTSGRVLNIATTVPVELNGVTITGGKASGLTGSGNYGGGLYISGQGTQVTLTNATIEGNYAKTQGGGVYIANGASLIMSGTSQIKDNAILTGGAGTANPESKGAGGGVYVDQGASFTLNGGTISGNGSADSGAAVYVRGTFTMNDGLIDSNKHISVTSLTNPVLSSLLGGVDVTQNVEIGVPGTFNMKGGSITSSLSDGWNGAGVCVYSEGGAEGTASFNMSGGTITGINFSTHYASVYLYGQSNCSLIFNMSGGSISGNTASSRCSGVYVGPNSSFIMTGGEISGNNISSASSSSSAGLYLTGNAAAGYPKITLGKSGSESTVKIKNNTMGSPALKSNLLIANSNVITIAGALTTASEVGITKTTEGAFTSGYSLYNSTRQPSLIFTSDNGKNITKNDSGEAATMTAIPLTLEAVSGPATVTFMNKASGPVTYKINGGTSQTIASNTTGSISLEAAGDRVEFFGDNVTYATQTSPSSYSKINCSADCYVYGNIMSLISSSGYASAVELKDNFTFTNLFSDNTKLKNKEGQLLELPATKLKQYSYYGMFQGCTGLTVAPDLPATTLDGSCYSLMFKGCTGLTAAPSLPATTLAVNCYSSMFSGCTGLTSAPELPARTLIGTCYSSMFQDCTSLETAPELPAETLYNSCYQSMFQGCTSLETAPELPVETLYKSCYESMFADCTSLMATPELPAEELAISCYQSMFSGCTGLTTVPADFLSATTLANYCYQSMFQGCTSLTTPPTISATKAAEYCCDSMFKGCTSLTTAPTLSVTTLQPYCYHSMFEGCTSLTTPPTISATKAAEYCCDSMFKGCTSLTTAPNLPATTLADYCYQSMFQGCTGLTTAPNLPATTLTQYCYQSMFSDCTSLESVPEFHAETLARSCYQSMFKNCTDLTILPEDLLPATTLANYCYLSMFYGCIGLTTLPEDLLSATTLATSCYSSMFNGCTGLTTVPDDLLPATTLVTSCYASMFSGCTGLTTIPDDLLPATTLADGCYGSMFKGCTSLTEVPDLPATTLASSCYHTMFSGCTGLTTLPQDLLPATTLTRSCYEIMFSGCTGLTTLPQDLLPATTLAQSCYYSMFSGCTGLTEAPYLPATTLAYACYYSMFDGCRNLSKVTCLATNITDSTSSWLLNVSSSGIFIKAPEMTSWQRSENGIPSRWVVFNPDGGTGSSATPLTLEAVNGPVTVTFKNKASGGVAYKVNGGEPQLIANGTIGTIELAAAGDKVEFYGNNTTYGSSTASNCSNISCSDDCYIYGNIMSLMNSNSYATATSIKGSSAFQGLFKGNTKIKNKEGQHIELPATTLRDYCYRSMFEGCIGLTRAPELPATSLSAYCYLSMFYGCTGLTEAPDLPATTLATCCYYSMFSGCTGLTETPILPATTLPYSCYNSMFNDCTNLSRVTCLGTNPNIDYNTSSWLSGVSSTGVFIKTPEATTWPSGVNGIPSGWTVIDYGSGFVPVLSSTFDGTSSTGTTAVFNSGRNLGTIKTLVVSDHETTQGEYERYCIYGAAAPDDGENYPVYNVSWYDAVVYCNLRSIDEGLNPVYLVGGETDPARWRDIVKDDNSRYCAPAACNWYVVTDDTKNGWRLPYEVEWEYVWREQNLTSTGQHTYCGGEDPDLLSWNAGNCSGPQPVKTKEPNSLKIYDMCGNVWEWMNDWHSFPVDASTPITGVSYENSDYKNHVTRGGGYGSTAANLTATKARNYSDNNFRYVDLGFRVVRNAQTTTEAYPRQVSTSYIGSKTPAEVREVGDIIFTDGSAVPYTPSLTLTDTQKAAAIAVIFYKGKGLNKEGDTSTRTLGVGLIQKENLAWARQASGEQPAAMAIGLDITAIQGDLTSGDKYGKDNLSDISTFLFNGGYTDDTTDLSNYPAFNYAVNYKNEKLGSETTSRLDGTAFEDEWYVPTMAELNAIYLNLTFINNLLDLCGGTQMTASYWSSNQHSTYKSNANNLAFSNGNMTPNGTGMTNGYHMNTRPIREF